jgi:hypothetical protein
VDVSRLLRQKRFFATPYGRGQWVSLQVNEIVNWKLIAQLVRRSYSTIATKRMVAALKAGPAH